MGVFLFYTVCVSKYNVEMPTPSLGDENKMKIVVLEGSPNKDGSSNLLATKFIRGAKEGGHSVQVIDAAMRIFILVRYLNLKDVGMVLGTGCGTVNMTRCSKFPQLAYEMGRTLF